MIGSLRGVLVERPWGGEVLVEVAGVGYRVTVAAHSAARLGGAGAPVFLWIHHHQREDAQTLYGFGSRVDRDCFELLLGAHGVGPALALAILAVHPPAELARVLADDDLAALCLVPGVGRKTAARLAVELKGRLLDEDGGLALVVSGTGDSAAGVGSAGAGSSIRDAPVDLAVDAAGTGSGAAHVATNGAGRNGPSANGTAGNGSATDGSAANAAASKATATNGSATNGSATNGTATAIAGPSPRTVVRQALAELGYGPDETRRALMALDDDASLAEADESTLLRAALRQMGR